VKPMRHAVRVHSALICIAVLFSLLMTSFGLIQSEQKVFAILLLTVFGEVVLLLERIFSLVATPWSNLS